MLEQQLKLEGYIEKDNIVEEISIPAEYYKIPESLIPILIFQIIKQIFSKVRKILKVDLTITRRSCKISKFNFFWK
jgi:hypothetical protein